METGWGGASGTPPSLFLQGPGTEWGERDFTLAKTKGLLLVPRPDLHHFVPHSSPTPSLKKHRKVLTQTHYAGEHPLLLTSSVQKSSCPQSARNYPEQDLLGLGSWRNTPHFVRPSFLWFLPWILLSWFLSLSCSICCQSKPLSMLSHILLFVTSWTVAHQAPLSVEFSQWEYWSGLIFPPPGDFLDPGIEPMSPVSPALAGGFFSLSHLGSNLSHLVAAFFSYRTFQYLISWFLYWIFLCLQHLPRTISSGSLP